jgi:hypothetical protein
MIDHTFRRRPAFLVALAILGLLTSCSHSGSGRLSSLSGADFGDHDLDARIETLQPIVEEALVWRVKAVEFYGEIKAKSDQGNLSADDLDRLYRGAESYFEMRDRLLPYTRPYLAALAAEGAEPDLESAAGRLMMKQIKLNLAAALVLYDNYMVGIYPYYADAKFRRLLRRDRASLSGKIGEITVSYLEPRQRQFTAYGIALVLKENEQSHADADNAAAYLDLLIEESPSFTYIEEKNTSRARFKTVVRRISDELTFLGQMFTYETSRLFGNTVGLVETRKGYLLQLPEGDRAAIAAALEPLDVALEKTPFRLTDKFIPGHYGHVGVWVGNEAQLTALGVWDDPAVVPYQAMIRGGQSMVEALRPGVQLNTREHFLNVDDLLILRHTNLTPAQRRENVLNAFRQIGKDYDFNFDVETDRRIVCSELAYVVFKNEAWPTSKTLGRYTISPDNVAVKAVSKNPFTPILLYYDGRKIDDRLEETLQTLLARDYGKIRDMHGIVRREKDNGGGVKAGTGS